MNKNKKIIFTITIAFFILSIILSLSLGSARLSLTDLWNAIQLGPGNGMASNIFWYVRLPRTIACVFAGAGLAVSGLVIQNVLSNKLASPGIIGVNSGAGLAVTICCALNVISGLSIALSAFFGALVAVLLVVGISQKMNASRTTVILSGVAINSFLNAASEAITTLYPEVAMMSTDFRVGGFTSVVSSRLLPACLCILIGIIVLHTLCNELDLMNLGEETAQGLGLSVKTMRTILLVLAALLAGASVSFSGLLGFIGLIIPHVARKLVGGESRFLLPFCTLGGAAFVTICDLAARLIFQPYEIPVGVLMSFIGGPFFIFLLLKSKGGHHRD